MPFKHFFKDKLLITILLIFGIVTIEIFLSIYQIELFMKIYIPVIIIGLYIIGVLVEYFSKSKFYNNVTEILNELEEKYLIVELIKGKNYIEEKILKDILLETNKSMVENVNKYKYLTEDYKEYIELWIHEIKIPIAASKMVIENNKNSITKSIDEELDKVENYIEQALFYARSNTVEKDYYVKRYKLNYIVNESIKKNKNILIQKKISLKLYNLDQEVYTDNKWCVFIINQIIQNSSKYMKEQEEGKIEIFSKRGIENVILYIKDNGIGIKKEEVTRVFEKGFTGTNGRLQNKKSTGIGLYLCKKLCEKLGIRIELNSTLDEGTEVRIVFPKGSYMEL